MGTIVLFAIIAAFVTFMLYKVLGRTNENDKPTDFGKYIKEQRFPRKSEGNVIDLPTGKQAKPEEIVHHDNPEISATLAAIHFIDRNFNTNRFIEGAKKAFEIIIDAFAKGDKQALSNLLSKEVYQEFAEAVDKRIAASEQLETTLIAIVSSDITDAELTKNMANITVKIVSDQVNVIKNNEGELISGDLSDVERIEDCWTFSRNVESSNPNWTLVATSHHG